MPIVSHTNASNAREMARSQLLGMAATALYFLKIYDDSNPDVGMGPSYQSLLDDVMHMSGVHLTEVERTLVINAVKNFKAGR